MQKKDSVRVMYIHSFMLKFMIFKRKLIMEMRVGVGEGGRGMVL